MITGSYIFINFISRASSAASSDDNGSNERNRAMQRKITVIILTDFLCWVPFILISILHFSGTIDATKYYGLCSIVVLPLNSVVNPLLYDGSLVDKAKSGITWVSSITRSYIAERRTEQVIANPAATDIELEEVNKEVATSGEELEFRRVVQ